MNIIIVGCGKVGYELAKNLSKENGVSVTLIDNKAESLEKASETIDAMLVRGNGLNTDILIEAGVKEADVIICVTDADETNILCCIFAKRLGVKNTVARVRNPEYALELDRFWNDLGLGMIINPEQQTAREISRLLRFPTVSGIDLFVGGRVELVSFKVSEAREFFVGKSVSQIFRKKKMDMLLAMIERGDSVIIPRGDVVFEENDVIRMIGRPSNIMNFFRIIGKNTERIRDITIIGSSKITYYLLELLSKHSSNVDIKVVEINKEKCEDLSESYPRCLVLNGDGTDEDMLSSEIVDKSGAIVCLTDRDEENAVIALYSMQFGIRKVIAKIDHINQNMVKNLGLGSIVSPKNITSDQIIKYIRSLSNTDGSDTKAVYRLFDDGESWVEAVEFNISGDAECLNTHLRDMKIKKGVLIGCIVRNRDIIIPTGDSYIRRGDYVIIIAQNKDIREIDDIIAS